MNDSIKTVYSEDKKYKLEIIQDEDSQSPDDWGDYELFLVYDHRQFTVKREGFEPRDIYNWVEKSGKDKVYKKSFYVFKVDAYIHSGVHLSLSNTVEYLHHRFDVSTTGYVLVNKSTANSLVKAKELAEDLLEVWNTYLSGNVYGFILYEKEEYLKIKLPITKESETELEIEWEEIDSCWGFYTDSPEDIEYNGILDHLPEDFKI